MLCFGQGNICKHKLSVNPQFSKWAGAMPCAGRFGKDAVDYAKGLAKGHSSCEQQALKEMLDLLSRCSCTLLRQTPHRQTNLKHSCSHTMPCNFCAHQLPTAFYADKLEAPV